MAIKSFSIGIEDEILVLVDEVLKLKGYASRTTLIRALLWRYVCRVLPKKACKLSLRGVV